MIQVHLIDGMPAHGIYIYDDERDRPLQSAHCLSRGCTPSMQKCEKPLMSPQGGRILSSKLRFFICIVFQFCPGLLFVAVSVGGGYICQGCVIC